MAVAEKRGAGPLIPLMLCACFILISRSRLVETDVCGGGCRWGRQITCTLLITYQGFFSIKLMRWTKATIRYFRTYTTCNYMYIWLIFNFCGLYSFFHGCFYWIHVWHLSWKLITYRLLLSMGVKKSLKSMFINRTSVKIGVVWVLLIQ